MAKKSGAKTARTRNRGNPGATPPRPVRGPRPNPIVPVERTIEPPSDAVIEPRAPEVPVRPVRTAPLSTARSTNYPHRVRAASHLPISTDYGYVVADLKRIGVLAGGAFVILAGLTLIIH